MIHKEIEKFRGLIGTLRSNGVTRYKCPEFEIEFDLSTSENEGKIFDVVKLMKRREESDGINT